MHHVLLGNGIAGIEAALVLRRRDPEARITLVSAEHPRFFARTALMYVLAGQLSLRDTEPYEPQLYERLRLEGVNRRVAGLDVAGRSLRFEDGGTLGYDRLLLAVGSRGRPAPWPGAQGPGVHHFVTKQDLEGLGAAVRKGGRAVVIGGGLIGVEVAEVLHHRGMHVDFLIREPWFFPVALDAAESRFVAAHIQAQGVSTHLGVGVRELVRDAGGRLQAVRTEAGELPCELVVVCIGVVPNTAFLAGSVPLSPQGAVETADDLSVPGCPGVFAAGDCANVTWHDGRRAPEQLWYTARDQGRIAAAAMLGDAVRYRRGTWYNSAKFFDIEYTTAGWVPPSTDPPDPELHTWYEEDPPASRRILVRGDRVVGFNMLGRRWDHQVLLRWIHERRSLAFVRAHLHEAAFDAEFTPAPRYGAPGGAA